MLRARSLHGRPVVDLTAARKLGTIDDVLLDPNGGQVAGFLVSDGHGLGGQRHWVLSGEQLYAIGNDVITVEGGPEGAGDGGDLRNFPRLSKLIGHKLVTQSGTVLGAISDVLLDERNG